MMTYTAFVRAFNVAGHASVKMTDLEGAFVAAGCRDVRTFIQSGNVLFRSPGKKSAALFQRIRGELRGLLGQEPGISFRTAGEIERIARAAPFRAFESDSDIKLYVAFLSG